MPEQIVGHFEGLRAFASRSVQAGPDPTGQDPSAFALPDASVPKGFASSRAVTPVRNTLESQLADLEGARHASAFGSGMAAVAGIAALLRAGDHVVATLDIYGGTHRFLTKVLPRYGIATTFVDMNDAVAMREAIRPNTKLFWIETPTNPLLRIIDIQAMASIRRPGQIVMVDNTLASPFFQKPLALGADVVLHTTTKYIFGQSDAVGGVIITNHPELHAEIAFHQNAVGTNLEQCDAPSTRRSAKTLTLHMRAHEANAVALANYLAQRQDIAEVHYPGLTSHPQYQLARRQMSGFGGIVSVRVRGGADRARAVARRTKVFSLSTTLGGVESLICNPAVMTHGPLTPAERLSLGITDDLLRLSVGIEDVQDLIRDLGWALDDVAVNERVPA